MLRLNQIRHVWWDQMSALDLLFDLEKRAPDFVYQSAVRKSIPHIALVTPDCRTVLTLEEYLSQHFQGWEKGWA